MKSFTRENDFQDPEQKKVRFKGNRRFNFKRTNHKDAFRFYFLDIIQMQSSFMC